MNMIKNFETYINEDYFSKLASRKDNELVRKELDLKVDSNIKDIKPIDMGTSVLWGDRCLCVYNKSEILDSERSEKTANSYMSMDLVNMITPFLNKNGWRLPTDVEISELNDNDSREMFYNDSGDNYMISGNSHDIIIDEDIDFYSFPGFGFWSSTEESDGYYFFQVYAPDGEDVYDIDFSENPIYELSERQIDVLPSYSYTRVLLVKDK